jgi:serine protease Do
MLGARSTGGVVAIGGNMSGVTSESGNAIVRAVATVGPAVMNVDTEFGKAGNSEFLPPPGVGEGPNQGKGTGVVFDAKNGYMLTNAHVVTNPANGAMAKRIQVTTRDGKKSLGRVRGRDRQSDIAVVELEDKSFPAARPAGFKDEKELDIGQWAIAIGNPFAQANTVTVGVVSAVGRTIPVPPGASSSGSRAQTLSHMIQTDAAINPGNSGGPLCNIKGEVIGINTAIFGIGTGLGFAIPINKASEVAQELIKNGRVRRPYLGIENAKTITQALQEEYGLKDRNGALVITVRAGSPAAAAGIQTGDVIRALDDKPMKTFEEMQAYVKTRKVGDGMKLEILRNSSIKKTVTLKIAERPDTED